MSGPSKNVEEKFDFTSAFPQLYAPKNREFALVTVPSLTFLAIDGTGDPDGTDFAEATRALYGIAYAMKFHSKKLLSRDYAVPPLEGLWWADDPSAFIRGDRSSWRWTLLSALPEWMIGGGKNSALGDAVVTAQSKGIARASDVTERTLVEGECFQALHIGPYAAETSLLAQLHDIVMPDAHVTFNGPHHEIYLSDPRRSAPDKLRTILRQPVVSI